MSTATLSEAALELLRYRLATGDGAVTPDNLDTYRELARAGLMVPVSGFVSGPEANFRFTEEGWAKRGDWLGVGAPRRGSS